MFLIMSTTARRIRGLRANALAAVVMLLIQYSLGVTVNLYSTLPAGDRGKVLFDGFGAAVGNGPVVLTLHALLGTLLVITASSAVIRSALLKATPLISLTAVALLAMLVAWIAGATFVGRMNNGSSLTMALVTAAALLCYVLVIFILSFHRTAAPRREAKEVPS
jgi:hypothetical protein